MCFFFLSSQSVCEDSGGQFCLDNIVRQSNLTSASTLLSQEKRQETWEQLESWLGPLGKITGAVQSSSDESNPLAPKLSFFDTTQTNRIEASDKKHLANLIALVRRLDERNSQDKGGNRFTVEMLDPSINVIGRQNNEAKKQNVLETLLLALISRIQPTQTFFSPTLSSEADFNLLTFLDMLGMKRETLKSKLTDIYNQRDKNLLRKRITENLSQLFSEYEKEKNNLNGKKRRSNLLWKLNQTFALLTTLTTLGSVLAVPLGLMANVIHRQNIHAGYESYFAFEFMAGLTYNAPYVLLTSLTFLILSLKIDSSLTTLTNQLEDAKPDRQIASIETHLEKTYQERTALSDQITQLSQNLEEFESPDTLPTYQEGNQRIIWYSTPSIEDPNTLTHFVFVKVLIEDEIKDRLILIQEKVSQNENEE